MGNAVVVMKGGSSMLTNVHNAIGDVESVSQRNSVVSVEVDLN